ncbi:phosphate/phosphite/phosphonate ABC transporter substrate-binding protein, partial [Burkholderia multivorans]
ISNAFMHISETNKGKKVISEIYGHEGYEKAHDKDFDKVRQYRQKIDSN